MDIVAGSGIGFDPASETGAVFHMIGALSQFGKMGVTVIGDSRKQADAAYRRVVAVFDQAGSQTTVGPGRPPHPFDINLRSIE